MLPFLALLFAVIVKLFFYAIILQLFILTVFFVMLCFVHIIAVFFFIVQLHVLLHVSRPHLDQHLFVFFIKFNAFSPPVFFFKLIFVHLFELLKFDDPFSQVNEKVKYKFYLLNSKNRQKFYHKFL